MKTATKQDLSAGINQTETIELSFRGLWSAILWLLVALSIGYAWWSSGPTGQPDEPPRLPEAVQVDAARLADGPAAQARDKALPDTGLVTLPEEQPADEAQSRANKALVSRVYREILNQGQPGGEEIPFATDFTYYLAGTEVPLRGAEGFKRLAEAQQAAIFDLHYVINELLAEGDQVVVRWTATGMPGQISEAGRSCLDGEPVNGMVTGVPRQISGTQWATGEPVICWPGVTVWRVVGGRLVDAWTIDQIHD